MEASLGCGEGKKEKQKQEVRRAKGTQWGSRFKMKREEIYIFFKYKVYKSCESNVVYAEIFVFTYMLTSQQNNFSVHALVPPVSPDTGDVGLLNSG